MERRRYDLNFKKMVVAKGQEVGNMTAVARQHELDPKMVLRWARELKRTDVDVLDGAAGKQAAFVPSAADYTALEKENEKLKKLYAEQALESEILRDLLKKNESTLEDKIAIAQIYIVRGHAIRLVLRIIGVERSTYYNHVNRPEQQPEHVRSCGRPALGYSYTQDGKRISDEQICEWIMEQLADEYASVYGYRKLTKLLRREHRLVVNKKKVYRLCKEMNVLRPQRKLRIKHPKRLANNRVITGSNQLWETDIKYGWIEGELRFFFLLSIIDVFDRAIVAYHHGLSCEAKHRVQITQEALLRRQLFDKENRPVIRSDNGPQFISHRFAEACEQFELIHERIPPKTPNKNAPIESFHAILELECYQRYEFENYQQAYEVISGFIDNYNRERIHGSIYDMSPYEYRAAIQDGTVEPKVCKV